MDQRRSKGGNGNRVRHDIPTGQQNLGGLNLYYYKARFYSPALGRFLQTDPIGTADDLNLYAYVNGNPISKTDPTGLATFTVGGTLRVPGVASVIIPGFIGQGVSAGVAVQVTDNSGNFSPDLGFYWSGAAGGKDLGVGRGAINFGGHSGTIADLGGVAMMLAPIGGVGGVTGYWNGQGQYSGASFDLGLGYNVGIAGSVGGSWSFGGRQCK